MKPTRESDQATSLWKRLMDSALQKGEALSANVLVFGDPKSGKKTLLNSILAKKNQCNELVVPNDKSILADVKKKGEINTIFDYRYLRVNKFEDDDLNELGKISFYSLNEKFGVLLLVLQRPDYS